MTLGEDPQQASAGLSRGDLLLAGGFALGLAGIIILLAFWLREPADCGLDDVDGKPVARADFECRMHQARSDWCRRWASSMTKVHECIEESEKTMREQVGGGSAGK